MVFQSFMLHYKYRHSRGENGLEISMRGFQAASNMTSSEIARLMDTDHQKIDYWVKKDSSVFVEYHYEDGHGRRRLVMTRVFKPEEELWRRVKSDE